MNTKLALLATVAAVIVAPTALGAAARGPSLAAKAATLDCGCNASRSVIAKYRRAIKALKPACKEKPPKYVGEAWYAHNDLAKHGKHLSTLGVLRAMRKSIPKRCSPPVARRSSLRCSSF